MTRVRRRTGAWLALAIAAALVIVPVNGWLPRHAAASGATAGGTLRVAMVDPAYHAFDPTTDYTTAEFAVARLLQRTLLTHRGEPGFEGTRVVPDLATALPTVAPDGRTWTFHIKPGIHYAPPLQDVEVTAQDFVRALERARSLPEVVPNGGPANSGTGAVYLPGLLAGFADFAAGKSSTISGAVALDAHTLQLRTIHPDRSLAQLLTLPFSAPIPHGPRPHSPLGIATGHDFAFDATPWVGPPPEQGFGPFQSATGPYMIEGADGIDYSLPADQQEQPSGFEPSWWDSAPAPGRLVLVRNPSWNAASDSVRHAYPDRIEITIQPADDPYAGPVESGAVDAVIGGGPVPKQLAAATGPARSQISRTDGNGIDWVMFNLLQPPFDDVHVRRAFSMALDREALTGAWARATNSVSQARTSSTIVPGSLVAGLLGGGSELAQRTAADAVAEMRMSRYWGAQGCEGAACRPITVGAGPNDPATHRVLADALESIGLRARFLPVCGDSGWNKDFKKCQRLDRRHSRCVFQPSQAALCLWGWQYDYPQAEAMFPPFDVGADTHQSATGLGLTAAKVRSLGFNAGAVPSVRADIARCAAALPSQAVPCWARLDQWLTDKIVAVVPFAALQSVRMHGSRVPSVSMDQATGEYALDQMALVQG